MGNSNSSVRAPDHRDDCELCGCTVCPKNRRLERRMEKPNEKPNRWSKLMSSPKVKAMILTGVELLEKPELGRGAYGKVLLVWYDGRNCAAKEFRPLLEEEEEQAPIANHLTEEFLVWRDIDHPNIVKFYGMTLANDVPAMVMELMKTSLPKFIADRKSNITIKTKLSILLDVSCGLAYLHTYKPPIVHCDLSSNNVLLTSELVAKIGDIGVTKAVMASDKTKARSKLTASPGTSDFMPPELWDNYQEYSLSVDVFSFAGVALHVFSEKWPIPLATKIRNPSCGGNWEPLTEARRRQEYLDKMTGGTSITVLKILVKDCLNDNPDERPSIVTVNERIRLLANLPLDSKNLICELEELEMPHDTHVNKGDEKYLAKAKNENLVVDYQHIKILLTGSAAVGKSSFCHLLFQSGFIEEYKSTEVINTKQAISFINFQAVRQEKEGRQMGEVAWLKLDLKYQLKHLKSLLESQKFHKGNLENTVESMPAEEILQDQDLEENQGSLEENQNSLEDSQNSLEGQGNVVTNVENKILSSRSLPESLHYNKIECVKLITVIDSGGQPEYIHMLPAITNCPAINFIVHDMTKNLDDPVIVRYSSPHGKSFQDYPLHYSNLDMIGLLMSLTTDSLEKPPTQSPWIKSPTKHFIGFIGTHKDKFKEEDCKEKVRTINDRLACLVEERNCKFAVLVAGEGVLNPVDNTTAGSNENEDPVAKKLRQKVEKFMDNIPKNQLPITWMILELELQQLREHNTKYVTLQEYQQLATDASMVPEEVEESVRHFDFLGVVLHFKDVPSLEPYVFIDQQWLFDNLAMIMHLSPEDIDFDDHKFREEFKTQRLLAKDELHIKEWESELHPKCFFDLLIFLKIIATVLLDGVQYYYMPSVLTSTTNYSDRYKFLLSEPLLVRFSSGFLPRGFFCSLVVHLLQNLPKGWKHQLRDIEPFSNVTTFCLPDGTFLRLHDKIFYLELQVRHYNRDVCLSYHSKILVELSKYISEIFTKLNFKPELLQYGFLCHQSNNNDDHIAIINPHEKPLPDELECCRKHPHQTILGKSHKIWFFELSQTTDYPMDVDTHSSTLQEHYQSTTAVPAARDVQILDKEPDMHNLQEIVTPLIKHEWENVAYSMQYKVNEVKAIERESQNVLAKCCEKMFDKWLSTNHYPTPHTWQKLLERIRKVDNLHAAAEIIEEKLKQL